MRRSPVLMLLVAVAATSMACGDSTPATTPAGGKPKGPVAVRTVPVRIQTVERVVEITGTLGGSEDVLLSAEVEGRVQSVPRDLGDEVAPGTVVVALNNNQARLATDIADAEYRQALARTAVDDAGLKDADASNIAAVKRTATELVDAERTFQRAQELAKKGVVTQNDVEVTQTRYAIAVAAHQQAREDAAAAIALAYAKRANLGMMQKRLRDHGVTSPVAGVVAERLVSVGEFVKVGQPLARVVSTSIVKLRGDVPERYAGSIVVGQAVALTLDATHATAEGKITRAGPVVSSTSHTFAVEAEFDNASGTLTPGAFSRLRITLGNDEQVVAVPETGVSNLAGSTKVFVFDNGKAREHKVELLRKRGSDALVVGDLRDGDAVIVTGIARLFEGADVKLDVASGAPAASDPPAQTVDAGPTSASAAADARTPRPAK